MNQNSLRISLSTAGPSADVHVIRIDGVIDTVTSPELDAVIASLVEQRRFRIILDMAGAHYVSSAGWGIFISRLREIREGGGDLKLARMTTDVQEIYDLLEFDGIIPRHDRLEAAQAAFNGGNGHSYGTGTTTVPAPPPRVMVQAKPTAPPVASPPLSMESALIQLVAEDPFYAYGEFQSRLAELGFHKVGRWTIWRTLRRHKLGSRRQRFRYYRTKTSGFHSGL